ncbi:DMT family transporter [Aestuariivita sp.]|uniref:DMT family transporter n=1 Tax=Aestuariivita sp. TaxID=1872407 RepID=UPI00216D5AA9|nr:DMT family transporter [Aestuariivita sp.]MCE8007034.1 DMT family transporter [Aestuariivita sp.]
MSPNVAGALLMMASMAAFTINDTFVKLVGQTIPLFQLLTLRAILATLLLLILARALGRLRFSMPRADRKLVAWRCLAEIAAAYFFLSALLAMPLANVTAILQVLPLTVTLGAALFFREQVGWRRMIAICVGFAGMVLIVRPGTDGFTQHSLFALAAVASVTVRDLVTRRMSAEVSSMTVTVITSASILVFAALASLTIDWQPVNMREGALIAASSLFIMGGYAFSVMVMRVGEVSAVAPFRYTGLLWALLLGWLVFGDWPDGITMLGGAIVVASGIFTLYRERRLKSEKKPA